MTCSPARLEANRKNAQLSSGPKTDEGKAISRSNALKHGLARETIAPTGDEAAEVAQLAAAITADLKPTCATGRALVERSALLSVRMNRCVKHEQAATADRVEKALADFDANRPEGPDPDPEKTARARARVADLALFDPSKEASLVRRYEAAAERAFFRILRELKDLKKTQLAESTANPAPAPPIDPEQAEADAALLASFRQASRVLADLKADPTLQVAVSAPQSPKPPSEAPNRPHLNRRQRRAALKKRA